MFGKKKPKLGFQAKARTRKDVQKEYAENALETGHKLRVLKQKEEQLTQFQAEITLLSKEIDQLAQKLIDLNIEGTRLPPDTGPETKEIA